MAHSVFISLTQQDTALAEALRDVFRALLGDMVSVCFSTSKELSGKIRHGEDWFQWIVDQVRECDFAFILVTPASAQKPWILWEAGAVNGAAYASGQSGARKVRPLVYQLEIEQVPSPIRDSKVQIRRGDTAGDVEGLFTEILEEYKAELPIDRISSATSKLKAVVQDYLASVSAALLRAPAVPTAVAIEEWLVRLDELLTKNRQSEAEHLHEWIEIAFGRGPQDERRPIDLRLHTRLASMYTSSREFERAAEQLELARRLVPRDIYILRMLGRCYLETKNRPRAQAVIKWIEELDPEAARNVEYAALAARYHRESDAPDRAVSVLRKALESNPNSHYLANLLGEASLEAHELADAKRAFTKALAIIDRLHETNIWTHATAANAAFVMGDDERARSHLRSISAAKPDAASLSTIEGGLQKLAKQLPDADERLPNLIAAVRGQPLVVPMSSLGKQAQPAEPKPSEDRA